MKRAIHNGIKTAMVAILLLNADACFAQVKRYPYVQDGKIIVCREGNNGVKSKLIHPNWTSTQKVWEAAETLNLVAARFEIASADNNTSATWEDALTACTNPWRLPTVREMGLITCFENELDGKLSEGIYWTCTYNGSVGASTLVYVGRWEEGRPHLEYAAPSEKCRVRCIRDF